MFQLWLHNGTEIRPDLRKIVYKFGIQHSDDEQVWRRLWNFYQNATIPQEKNRLLSALAQTRTVWLINRLLAYTFDVTKIRTQDFFSLIYYVSINPVGRPVVWNWIRINYDNLLERFTLNHRGFGRMIPLLVKLFNTQFHLDEVEAFFSKYPEAGAGERGRRQALETIRANIAWSNDHVDHIVDWLRLNVQYEE
jgi:glutamyl aminopeptidase